MQHLELKAATSVIDQEVGEFEALASAWVADRENDTIAPDAFDATIRAWQESGGKQIPLLHEHSTTAVGSIDPATMHTTDDGLVVTGQIDRSTEKGQQAWAQIKAGAAGFSIGFMADSRAREGGRELVSIDLLEISITSTPTHPATRALSWKSMDNPEFARIRAEAANQMLAALSHTDAEELKRRSDQVIAEAKSLYAAAGRELRVLTPVGTPPGKGREASRDRQPRTPSAGSAERERARGRGRGGSR